MLPVALPWLVGPAYSLHPAFPANAGMHVPSSVLMNTMLPFLLSRTVNNLLSTVHKVASQDAPLFPTNDVTAADVEDTREKAWGFIKALIIGSLPLDDHSGTDFIS